MCVREVFIRVLLVVWIMMKSLFVAVLAAVVALAVASNVVELTPDNFDQYVDGSRDSFIEFYAPWYARFSPVPRCWWLPLAADC